MCPKGTEWKTWEVEEEDFEEIAMEWLQMNRKILSPKTTNRRLTSLKAFARWAGWGNPLEEYAAPTAAKGQPHPLPEGIEGVYRMIEAAHNERQKTLVVLCGLCGLRISEALKIKATHFDFANMVLRVPGKGDKERIVPVSERAWNVIAPAVVRAGLKNLEVVGLKDRFARRAITELGVRAGLQRRVASHDLRATFATAVYDSTLDQRVVQELLGHANGSTTEVYIGRTAEQMRKAVEGL
jgi:integrase